MMLRLLQGLLAAGVLVVGAGCATAEPVEADVTGGSPLPDGGGFGPQGSGGSVAPGAGGFVSPSSGGTPVVQAGGSGPTGGTGAGGGSGAGGASACSSCTAPLNGRVLCTGGVCDFECNSGFAKSGTSCARIVSCTDTMKNGSETDVDCGGATCPKCAPGLECNADADCDRGPCETDGKCGCTPDTCESGLSCAAAFDDGCGQTLDCLGSCVAPAICYQDSCCTAATACDATTCSPTFSDGCGGALDCTGNCAATDVCLAETCCTPKICDATTCGQTTDGCGTALACPPCADGASCATGADCQSAVCEAGKCVGCTDTLMNNGETDIDCGGGTCPPCASDKKCKSDSDCQSGTCCGAFGPIACLLQPGDTCQ